VWREVSKVLARAKGLLNRVENDLGVLPKPQASQVAALVAIGYCLVELVEAEDRGPELWGFEDAAVREAMSVLNEEEPLPPGLEEIVSDDDV
jgi:hypothetical protein